MTRLSGVEGGSSMPGFAQRDDREHREPDEEHELAEDPGVPADHGELDADPGAGVPVHERREREDQRGEPDDPVAGRPESTRRRLQAALRLETGLVRRILNTSALPIGLSMGELHAEGGLYLVPGDEREADRQERQDREHDPEAGVRAASGGPVLDAPATAGALAEVGALDRRGVERGRILVESG